MNIITNGFFQFEIFESDNHKELISCQKNINYFILTKYEKSFFIWNVICRWTKSNGLIKKYLT